MDHQQQSSRPHAGTGMPPRYARWARAFAITSTMTAVAATASVALGAAGAAAGTTLSCPGGSYNLCIPAQGANEAATGTAGSKVVAGYDFTIPGSDTTTVFVRKAFEQLTVSCASGATPTQPTMPNATYTAPYPSSQGWVPTGDQSSTASYEGSLTLPNLCNGGTIDVGQPGQMLFAAQVESNGTSSLRFRSHYNDASLSKSGSWSATASVTPAPITQTIQGETFLCVSGAPSTTLASGGTISVPAASLSSPNPLHPTDVPAESYTMNATAPSGDEFVACGKTGVTITSPGTAHQTVTVAPGGAGNGKFYVQAVQRPTGYLEICKHESGEPGVHFLRRRP
jgi:hypothetical protein